MIPITMSPGATTAAARLICPSPQDPAAGRDEHEEERPQQLGEQAPVLELRVIEVLPIPELQHQHVVGPLRVVNDDGPLHLSIRHRPQIFHTSDRGSSSQSGDAPPPRFRRQWSMSLADPGLRIAS